MDNAQKELGLATARRVAAESARAELGDAVAYTEYRNRYANYERSKEQLDEATAEESQARERERELSGLLAKAKKRLEYAREAVLDAKFKNAAHELRGPPSCQRVSPARFAVRPLGRYQDGETPIGDVAELEGTLAERREQRSHGKRSSARHTRESARHGTCSREGALESAKSPSES